MIILACETSTLLGSVAVLENDKPLASEQSFRKGSHSDVLNLYVEDVLNTANIRLSDVDLFASGIGPGSFTGLRISLNTIKTLAYCQNKPVIGINSLQTLAWQLKILATGSEFEKTPIISMINAYKNMVYVSQHGFVNQVFTEVKKPEVVRVQNLAEYFSENSLVCGDGYAAYEKYFSTELKQKMIRLPSVSDEPHAKILGQLAYKNHQSQTLWNQLLPLYIRASEAEENLKGIKYQPLI